MRAIICRAYGSPELLTLENIPAPVAEPGEVVVAVRAIGLNFTDLMAVEGRSQLRRELPLTPGVELAGVVEALGQGVTSISCWRPAPRALTPQQPW